MTRRATWTGVVLLVPVVVGWVLLALAFAGWDQLADAAFESSPKLCQTVMAGAPVVAALLGFVALRTEQDRPLTRVVAYGGGALFVLFVIVAAVRPM